MDFQGFQRVLKDLKKFLGNLRYFEGFEGIIKDFKGL